MQVKAVVMDHLWAEVKVQVVEAVVAVAHQDNHAMGMYQAHHSSRLEVLVIVLVIQELLQFHLQILLICQTAIFLVIQLLTQKSKSMRTISNQAT